MVSDVVRRIEIERHAAATLLIAIHDDIGDDADAMHDMVLAETGLMEAIDRALARHAELGHLQAAIAEQIGVLKARQERFSAQADRIWHAIQSAIVATGLRKAERPAGTIYLAKRKPELVLEPGFLIPPEFARTKPPEPDRVKIRAALESGQRIAGASLVPQPDGLRIKTT